MDSRIEQLLNALLNGEEPPIEPQSRNEAYLYSLCKQGVGSGGAGGVSSWNDLTDKPFESEIVEVDIAPEQTVTVSNNTITFVDWKDPCYDLQLITDPGGPLAAKLVLNDITIDGEINYYYAANGMFGSHSYDYDHITLGHDTSIKDGDTVTIRMYAIIDGVKTLDTKYLPISVPKDVPEEAGMVPISKQFNGEFSGYENIRLDKYIFSAQLTNCYDLIVASNHEDDYVDDLLFENLSISKKITIYIKKLQFESETTSISFKFNNYGSRGLVQLFNSSKEYIDSFGMIVDVEYLAEGSWKVNTYPLVETGKPECTIIDPGYIINEISIGASNNSDSVNFKCNGVTVYGV